MTAPGQAVARVEESGPRPGAFAKVVACAFCRRRLAEEYYFTCMKCERSYCYIHMSRHQPSPCTKHVSRRRGAQASPNATKVVGVPIRNGNQLLLAGPPTGPKR